MCILFRFSCRFNKLLRMKILLIVFCFTSIKSILCVHGLASPQWLNSFRRKHYMPNHYHRVNPDLAKLIFLKQLLELDSIRNIYLKNRQNPHQFPAHHKLTLSTSPNAMSAIRNNGMHSPRSNGVKKKHFLNPKIIILPPRTSTEETFGNNFQNHKELNHKTSQPQYLRIIPEDREKMEAADSENKESFQKEAHGGYPHADRENFKSSATKNFTLEENKKVTFPDVKVPDLSIHPNPKQPSNITYLIPILFNHIKSSPTRIQEVEEIIEGTVNVNEKNFKKLSMGEIPYFENNIESDLRNKQEQKVLDNSIMTIIKKMTERVTNSPPIENMLGKVFADNSSKVPSLQTTTTTQFQNFTVLPSDATKIVTKKPVFSVKTNLIDKKYPSQMVTQHPDLLSNNNLGTLKPSNKIPKIFEISPSVATSHITHANNDEENTPKIESEGFETPPLTFFEFFNKEPTDSLIMKPEIISEKMKLNPFTLSFIPPKLFDEIPQNLFKNLVTDDSNLKMINNEPPNFSTKSFSQNFNDSIQTENLTFVPFTRSWSTKPNSTFKLTSHSPAGMKTTVLKTVQEKNDEPRTTASTVILNSNSTTSNFKLNSHSPAEMKTKVLKTVQDKNDEPRTTANTVLLNSNSATSNFKLNSHSPAEMKTKVLKTVQDKNDEPRTTANTVLLNSNSATSNFKLNSHSPAGMKTKVLKIVQDKNDEPRTTSSTVLLNSNSATSNFKLNSHSPAGMKTKVLKTVQDKNDEPRTTSSTVVLNSNSTTSNFKLNSHSPAGMKTKVLKTVQDKNDEPRTTSSTVILNSNSTTSNFKLSSHSQAGMKTTVLKTLQEKNDESRTTASTVILNSNSTTSNFKLSSHSQAGMKTTVLKTVQDKNDEPRTTSSTIILNSNSTTSNLRKSSDDDALSIDLLSSTTKPELKKDQESSGKNSRKINFSQDIQKETTPNRITESSDPHPRRSDILITDYTDDYMDNENRFSNMSYLERIKSNDTILTATNINTYIPLLPDIINDIRRNKIPEKDLSLFSKIFGKYWPNILAISSNKKMDVLPLLTMKNEKDLISFMESQFSNESKTSAVKIGELKIDNKDSLKQAYDYDGAYEDLYDYVFGHETNEKRKQFRHKRDDELEYQKLEANIEYFESLAEEQRNGKIEYMVEYAMYDESLEDDNISVLELIKPADLYVKLENETHQEEPNYA